MTSPGTSWAPGPIDRERHPILNGAGWSEGLRERLRRAVGTRSYHQIARDTGVHPETARRYLRDGTTSGRFIAALCKAYGISCAWLLLGTGAERDGPHGAPHQHPGQQPEER